MTDDPTARARVEMTLTGINQNSPAFVLAPEGRRIVTIHGDGRIEIAADLAVDEAAKEFLEALAKYAFGKQLIDTRTHVAVAREPSEEVVERVAFDLCALVNGNSRRFYGAMTDHGRDIYRHHARAAIAALAQDSQQ